MSDKKDGGDQPQEQELSLRSFVESGEQGFNAASVNLPRSLAPFAKAGPRQVHKLIRPGSIPGDRLAISSFNEILPATAGFDVTNFTETYALDASTATVGDVANVLATLLAHLKTKGILG